MSQLRGVVFAGWVLVALGGALACMAGMTTPPPATAGAAGGGCDLGARAWVQSSAGPCGSSAWRFSRAGDGSWQATEAGCGNATGMARYDGRVVTLDFKYQNGAGIYSWPLDGACGSAPGTVTWTEGPLKGQTVASTLAPAP
jgi:hypothetical protein